MSQPGGDQWLEQTFNVKVTAWRQAAAAGGNSGTDPKASSEPSAGELMQRAAAKAKQEADAAAADAGAKSADADAKRQAATAAREEAEKKFGAEYEIETVEAAERDADKIGGPTPSSPDDPSAAELLKQAEAKAKQEAEEAGQRFRAAGEASEQANAAAKTAKALAEAKAKVAADAAAVAEHQKPTGAAAAGGPAGDGAKKLPRPMEPDCKPVSGKMPDAPDNINLCEPHGHVVDTAKKLIVAETPEAWRHDHPRAKRAPAAAKPMPTGGGELPPGTKLPIKQLPPDIVVGSFSPIVDVHGDVSEIVLSIMLRLNGDVDCHMKWRYADAPAGDVPGTVHEEVQITGIEDIGTAKSRSHKVEPGQESEFKRTLKWKPHDNARYQVAVFIVADGAADPLFELHGDIDVNYPVAEEIPPGLIP